MSINDKSSAHRESGMVLDRSRQGKSILVEWPQGEGSFSRRPSKKVTVSEYSEQKIYENGGYSNKCYSSADRKEFQSRAARDAYQIQSLVSSPNHSAGDAILQAIKLGLLQKEELVGIEDLVIGEKAIAEMRRQRKVYIASVLKAQTLMQGRNSNGVDTVMLAKVARMLSTKSVEKALLRAASSLDAADTESLPTSRSWGTMGNASTRAANAA